MARRKRELDGKPVYWRYSDGIAAGRFFARAPESGILDDIILALEPEEGRGVIYEFTIQHRSFQTEGAKLAIEVCVFDEAFQAFADFPDLFAWLGDENPTTLDEVQDWLDDHGFQNKFVKEWRPRGRR